MSDPNNPIVTGRSTPIYSSPSIGNWGTPQTGPRIRPEVQDAIDKATAKQGKTTQVYKPLFDSNGQSNINLKAFVTQDI